MDASGCEWRAVDGACVGEEGVGVAPEGDGWEWGWADGQQSRARRREGIPRGGKGRAGDGGYAGTLVVPWYEDE